MKPRALFSVMKPILRIRVRKPAFVLVFVALVIPGLLLLAGMVLQSGQLYVRHTELHHVAREAGVRGLRAFSETLASRATVNRSAWCRVEEPPDVCRSSNRFDFVSDSEIYQMTIDSFVHHQVLLASEEALAFDPEQTLDRAHLSIIFPEDFTLGTKEIRLRSIIEQVPDPLLSSLLVPQVIRGESLMFLKLP